ncbi:periplasmic or exported protein [Klebsiella michiganensis]|uniref:Periplasmic or exported protein n=1 Tax=Klebsiella michiganensis TaxID=1134687 RepID=A0A7H4PL89_9ENTR|nr:periplasmic or exported protein [Klebsiella michiganensis]
MKLNAFTLTLAPLLVAGAFSAHAGPQAHVVCAYHHTLGDDAIMMFGKPNQAMWHDFFGNTHTDAVSTYQTLRDQPETTCDNKADGSAYWVPSMKLPDGQVVTPAYQKTYYQTHQSGTVSAAPVPGGSRTAGGRSPRFGAQLAHHLFVR